MKNTALFLMNLSISLLASMALATPASTSTLQAYAFSAGGQSSNPTTGPTSYMRNDYPGGQSGKYYIPTPGSGFGVQEDTQYFTDSKGPLTANSSVNVTRIGPDGNSSYGGSSSASSSYGRLGVSAFGSYSGLTDSNSVRGSESFATFTESLMIPGGAGESGYFVPKFTVDGTWSKTGSAAVQFEMDYRVNNGPTFMSYRIQGDTESGPTIWYNRYVDTLPGLTVGPLSVSGSTDISISPIPIFFNQSFDLTIALFSAVLPYNNEEGSADFLHTAVLSGISVLDAHGIPLANFDVNSGSGTLYTSNGVLSPIPEPASIWLMIGGLLGLIMFKETLINSLHTKGKASGFGILG